VTTSFTRSLLLVSPLLALLGAVGAACSPDSSDDGAGGGGPGGGTVQAECGNGIVEGDEECDDANFDDEDGCDVNCFRQGGGECGNGAVEGNEECDDGNDDDTDQCLTGCLAAYCGDGFVKSDEECDDGNGEDGDACSNDCVAGVGCGNGTPEGDEECDDGNESNADACAGCLDAFCGDGFAQLGVEDCDDGNDEDGDNCHNDCTLGDDLDFGCPGADVTVNSGSPVELIGNTADADDVTSGLCGGLGAPEVAYAVMPTDDGTLFVTMTGLMGVDPVLHVRSGDCETGPDAACADDDFTVGGTETAAFEVTAGETYWVFADGYDGTAGPYALTLDLQTVVQGDACPGIPVAVALNQTVTEGGNTALASTDGGVSYKGKTGTACAVGASTKDIVYAVTPAVNGKLVVSLDPLGFDGNLYARSGSCTTGPQLACSESAGDSGLELLNFPVVGGTKYSVFVDGVSGDAGDYNIEFHLNPP
jgi:cysteine-rich repeat protein